MCIDVCVCAINYMCVHMYAYKVMGWNVCSCVWCVCVKERERQTETAMETEERAHPSQRSLGSACGPQAGCRIQPSPGTATSGRHYSVSFGFAALCAVRNQEGELFWKRTEVLEKIEGKRENAEEAGEEARLPEKRQRPRTHVGDLIGKLRQA